ncbi:MAG: hypothetical protein A2600_01965 [Candidatus Lambdaproteobacteria bacterium RIFOXYD1_FULL_56_27]|uniref:Response regulatory domain-containing protein n=1 Tax=Candidatus Lambdaproteobacteria bacterium RIFOXYD2_FULL_56_26 TaxID=1817773 RepID=A0A1F6GMS6_9PROT|nr:MAG: hypothetical protein A2557_12465 [Candidatus Lambdaproteobacteria bacterium RIFOXYD2_FULL_56_26]OGH05605.1 MAG: hypothetical protein A2426_04755 [Candidatus Lambdaproteobacteria bacterium RIFOXYC1_FULL_56_13]OGH08565.1 MAG: hypothetical protein A2600_01965 [Candidatus Lambdaproteobacteria bacterium RIFOXYD1_FULL_56_27]
MKTALLSLGGDPAPVLALLQGRGLDLQVFTGVEALLSAVAQDPTLELVLVEGDSQTLLLDGLPKLRRFPYYLYLVYLADKTQADLEGFYGAGIDEVLPKNLSPSLFAARLAALNRLFEQQAIRSYPDHSTVHVCPCQTLNLDTGLKFAGGDLFFFRTLVELIVRTAKDLKEEIDTGPLDPWYSLNQNATSLGAEELAEWTFEFLARKGMRQGPTTAKHQRMKTRFPKVIHRLEQALGSLKLAGYFDTAPAQEEREPFLGTQVLLVEDMKHNRLLLRRMLSRKGCSVTEAIDGEQGLAVYKKQAFDLVVMDMNMPVMDGFAASRAIRDFEQALGRTPVPILALTALAMRGDKEKCLEAGCTSYLPKPVDAEALYRQIGELLPHLGEIKARNGPVSQGHRSVALYTCNQVFRYLLTQILQALEWEVAVVKTEAELVKAVEAGTYSLVLVDQEQGLELAFLIRDQYPTQALTLVNHQDSWRNTALDRLDHVIQYPFDPVQVQGIIEFHQSREKQKKRFDEILEDFNSLKAYKGQVNIQENVAQGEGQLAVWQKAFRKIGGDLVLSQRFNLHGRFGLILADVSGHDIQSAYTASWFAGLVKGSWGRHQSPLELLVYLNGLFDADKLEEDKRYVCALALLWDPMEKRLSWANAGIPSGLMVRADGLREPLNWRGIPIGMFPELQMFDHGELVLETGDFLLVATDGILELVPRELIGQLSLSSPQPQERLDQVVDFVVRSSEVTDDLTLAVFEPKLPKLAPGSYRNKLHSNLPSVYAEVKSIRAYLDGAYPELELDWAMVSLAIKEALLNAVEHGNKKKEQLPVWVDAWVVGNRLWVLVSDQGPGFDLSSEKHRLEQEGILRIQGRGIQLMEAIAQEISFWGGSVKMSFGEVAFN